MNTTDLILQIITIVLSLILILIILIQQRGAGLGGAFGGDSGVYRTRRGAERFIFRLTIIVSLLFAAAVIASVVL